MQLGVECDEHGADAPLGVGAEHPEPLAVGCRSSGAVGGSDAFGVPLDGRVRADIRQRGLDVAVAQAGQALAGRTIGVDRCQAFLGIAAMLLDMPRHEKIHGGPIIGAQIPVVDEMIGDRSELVLRPGLKGSDELPVVDQAILDANTPNSRSRAGS